MMETWTETQAIHQFRHLIDGRTLNLHLIRLATLS